MTRGKRCVKCGADDWKARSDGYYCCAACNRARAANWYHANRERALDYSAKMRAKNPEKCRANHARWHQKNVERHRASAAEWARTNPEKARARSAKWYADNAEAHRASMLRWARENPDNCRARNAKRRALKQSALGRGITPVQWQEVLNASLGICAYCNKRRPLTLDHIEPLARGGWHDIENAAAICRPCNSSKHDTPLLLWLVYQGAPPLSDCLKATESNP